MMEKLLQMDQRTRKLMTMHKALNLRDDIEILYIGGRRLARIDCSGDTLIQQLENYIKRAEKE